MGPMNGWMDNRWMDGWMERGRHRWPVQGLLLVLILMLCKHHIFLIAHRSSATDRWAAVSGVQRLTSRVESPSSQKEIMTCKLKVELKVRCLLVQRLISDQHDEASSSFLLFFIFTCSHAGKKTPAHKYLMENVKHFLKTIQLSCQMYITGHYFRNYYEMQAFYPAQ